MPTLRTIIAALATVALTGTAVAAPAQSEAPAASPGAQVGGALERGAKAAANGIERGARAAAHGVQVGVSAAARGIARGAEATARAADTVARKVQPSGASSTPAPAASGT